MNGKSISYKFTAACIGVGAGLDDKRQFFGGDLSCLVDGNTEIGQAFKILNACPISVKMF